MDVYGETIAIAYAEEGRGEPQYVGQIPNRVEAVRRIMDRMGVGYTLKVCYEAGPTGYGLYWELCGLGVDCEVIAPSLVPQKPGDRVKTDKRDACKLAQSYRNGELTAVFVPTKEVEAVRDLVRARETGKAQEREAKQRLKMFLLRKGVIPPKGVNAWTQTYHSWLRSLVSTHGCEQAVFLDLVSEVNHQEGRVTRLEEAIEASVSELPQPMQELVASLCSFRGIRTLTAMTVVTETGDLRRFKTARQLMGYSGLVPSEHSSGKRVQKGGITKTGNVHLRRILIETAWHYQRTPYVSKVLLQRQKGQSPLVTELAWKAQQRLHKRHQRLLYRGKPLPQVVTALALELCGFVWPLSREQSKPLHLVDRTKEVM